MSEMASWFSEEMDGAFEVTLRLRGRGGLVALGSFNDSHDSHDSDGEEDNCSVSFIEHVDPPQWRVQDIFFKSPKQPGLSSSL